MTKSLLKSDSLSNCRIRQDVPSNQLTTFGIGKGVSLLIEPESVESLIQSLTQLDDQPLFLGNGSNVVLPDQMITRPVVRLPKSLGGAVENDTDLFELLASFGGIGFYAGSSLINLSRTFSQAGKTGLEFAAGIPGTLGGGIKMNAGAHGESLSQVISGIVVADLSGKLLPLDKKQLDFSYRHSAIEEGWLILAASISVKDGDIEQIRTRREKCLEYRTKTQPLKMPSAGSVFRNPTGPEGSLEAAAFYLEKVGLKGYQKAGVGYSSLHSNWLVRLEDSAKAEAVGELIELGKKRVFEEYGLNLTPEILLW